MIKHSKHAAYTDPFYYKMSFKLCFKRTFKTHKGDLMSSSCWSHRLQQFRKHYFSFMLLPGNSNNNNSNIGLKYILLMNGKFLNLTNGKTVNKEI